VRLFLFSARIAIRINAVNPPQFWMCVFVDFQHGGQLGKAGLILVPSRINQQKVEKKQAQNKRACFFILLHG